jgi:hypothetical protein
MSPYTLQGIAVDVVEKICCDLRRSERIKAKKLYMAAMNCYYDEAATAIDNLEIEMIKNNDLPNSTPKEDLSLCGICKNIKLRRNGFFFHAGDDWMHLRLFVCTECMSLLSMQRTLHELCYECREHLPDGCCEPSLIGDLWDTISRFEKAHSNLFNKLPPSTNEECLYPGSLNPGVGNWLEKHKIE